MRRHCSDLLWLQPGPFRNDKHSQPRQLIECINVRTGRHRTFGEHNIIQVFQFRNGSKLSISPVFGTLPVPGEPPGAVRYLPRTEGLIARVQHLHAAGSNSWEVRSKDGLVSRYGTPCPPGAALDWRDPAALADPEDPARISAWRLTRTTDPFENRIEYVYERDAHQANGPHRWDQLYLSEIRYVDHGDGMAPQFLGSVRFTYDDRPDPFTDYRPGFEVRTVRRCTQITVFTRPGEEILTRTYRLEYFDQQGPPPEVLPPNGVSLRSRIHVQGHDGAETEELPPLEFRYTPFEPAGRRFFPLQGSDLPARSLANPDLELVDLFGKGTPDILEMNGTARFWHNLGEGRSDLPRPMQKAPAGLRPGGARGAVARCRRRWSCRSPGHDPA